MALIKVTKLKVPRKRKHLSIDECIHTYYIDPEIIRYMTSDRDGTNIWLVIEKVTVILRDLMETPETIMAMIKEAKKNELEQESLG